VSILDPRLIIGLPPPATAATGVDALVHHVESLTSRSRNPVSKAYARHAVRLVYRWLPRAVADGGDIEARAHLMLGALVAGLALSISGLGLVHGIAHAVTAHTGAAHGTALAAVFDRVLDFNLVTSAREYGEIAFDLGVGRTGVDEAANAVASVAALGSYMVAVGAYTRLRDLGVVHETISSLTRAALADPLTRNAPRMRCDARRGFAHRSPWRPSPAPPNVGSGTPIPAATNETRRSKVRLFAGGLSASSVATWARSCGTRAGSDRPPSV
jgi:alcohol dehydrogenase class IV